MPTAVRSFSDSTGPRRPLTGESVNPVSQHRQLLYRCKRGVLKYYTLPANQVTLRNKRELSDEQRAELSARAKAMRAAQTNGGTHV